MRPSHKQFWTCTKVPEQMTDKIESHRLLTVDRLVLLLLLLLGQAVRLAFVCNMPCLRIFTAKVREREKTLYKSNESEQ